VTDRGITWRGTKRYEDAARVPRMADAKGTNGSRLEEVGHGPAQMPKRRCGRRAAHGAARPTERPANRRHFRVRPGCFPAGQHDFD
jgi:hypothetical protein